MLEDKIFYIPFSAASMPSASRQCERQAKQPSRSEAVPSE